ncbi:MAG: hypothetical protein IKV77_10620 [Alistipes sp.]|nr:hypothetical protein [Alistipes sp.]MBR5893106.1 hypothetical protein [Bacteroidaceae bacterium]
MKKAIKKKQNKSHNTRQIETKTANRLKYTRKLFAIFRILHIFAMIGTILATAAQSCKRTSN